MVEEHVEVEDVDDTCFLDIDIDSFRVEPLVLQENKTLHHFLRKLSVLYDYIF